jgi:hypothetical protein
MTDYDPRDVLDKYLAELMVQRKLIVRDIAELPYSKDVIKTVLRGCLKGTRDEKTRRSLKSAYIFLASFQELSEPERNAVEAVGDLSAMSSNVSEERARSIADVSPYLADVLVRFKAEVEQLNGDL